MASTRKDPDLPIVFRGIDLSGNPVRRPSMTASVARDVRVMPGNWIRLRGGRRARTNTVSGTIMQIRPFRDPNFAGANNHLAQIRYTSPSKVVWNWFDLATYYVNPFGLLEISTAYDSGYCLSNLAAQANITDRPVFYNGLGVRDGTNSRPPLHSYYAGILRYFGLDAYCPTGANPTVAFAAGAGNNVVGRSVRVWVGLYHEPTAHFSNGVYCGEVASTGGATGTITVSNLARLSVAHNNITEENELKYVFYASVDGGQVGYLIMNALHTGPYTAPVSSSSFSLSIQPATIDDPNGWLLDVTTEVPTQNHPPRPMKCLAAVAGRLYGIPLQGGSGGDATFSYVWGDRERSSVVWSAAAGDNRETKQVGDPQQCWPLVNRKEVPSIEQPIWCVPSIGGDALIVWTPKSTFILTELSNGLHVYNDISRIHGLGDARSVAITKYGIVWKDQLNQLCLLQGDTAADLSVISTRYQAAMSGKTSSCANYLIDPRHEIDRYQIWFTDGTFVVHDFRLRDEQFPEGQAYTGTGMDFTAAATLVAQDGKPHYVVAKGGFYTMEAQPEDGLIPTRDQSFVNTTDQTTSYAEINGEYRFNWDRITDFNTRKSLAEVVLICDGEVSPLLTTSPVKMRWWGDFEEVPAAKTYLDPTRVNQTAQNWQYRFSPTQSNRFIFKVGFSLAGHAGEGVPITTYPLVSQEGDLPKNFYGSIMEAGMLFGNEGNRP